jgi:MinD superfamily P-loop ATPase
VTQLVILSGKGGTGKTNLSAAFSHLYHQINPDQKAILVDADVDAANLALVLEAEELSRELFIGGAVAKIDPLSCNGCGRCQEVCRFEAVSSADGQYRIDPIFCEGCAACLYQCPEDAILLEKQQAGEWYISETPYGKFFHAHLYPAQENSGKLVALIKTQAQEELERSGAELMMVDGPPGIGCPVISAVSGADVVLVVTEPTLASLHDLGRVLETTAHFKVQVEVCINKTDLYPEGAQQIRNFCREKDIDVLGEIPFDLSVPRAMTQGQPVTKFDPQSPSSLAIKGIWEKLMTVIDQHNPVQHFVQIK